MQRVTTLGLNERLERVLTYLFGWASGLVFFVFEKNRNVRWHALQSMITFGPLFVLWLGVTMLKAWLSWIPLLSWLTNFGLGLLQNALWWVMIILWLWLMLMAWIWPDYRLPFISEWMVPRN